MPARTNAADRLLDQLRRYPSATDYVRDEIVRRAGICAGVLDEARRLCQQGRFEAPLRRLASRSGELLGDIDEMIPVLDSKRDRGALMSVATLHRRLESLLVAIAEHRPAGHSAPASTSPR